MCKMQYCARLPVIVACASAVSGMLCGCASINPELGPASPNGPSVSIDTLSPTATAKAKDRSPAQPALGESSPSVVAVTRENWRPTQFVVPVSGVQHHPIYTDDKPHFARQTARARGEHPTQVSSLEVTTQESGGSLALEGLAAPVRAAWDILRMPVEVFVRPPWSVQQSPIDKQPFQRGPAMARKEPITGSPVPPQPSTGPIDPNSEGVGKTAEEAKKDEADKARHK